MRSILHRLFRRRFAQMQIGPNSRFLDVGAKAGGSMLFASDKHNVPVENGVGIDLRERFLQEARKKRLNVLKMNALELGFKDKAFEFAYMLDFLEHLKSQDEAARAISETQRVTKKFIFIENPNFEYTEYLRNLDLKFYWSDWTGHPFHITKESRDNILQGLHLKEFQIKKALTIHDSFHKEIVPISAPRDTTKYDEQQLGPKKLFHFHPPLMSRLQCTIFL
jgi:2-polyprenyl-3-methyl-5-hydroxy-6-metoxy-1,4-benzoquinol methylase